MSETPRKLRTGGFDELFAEGREFATPQLTATVELADLGRLSLPTGRLTACDPLVAWELDAFTVDLPPGDHPVVLSVAHIGTLGGVLQEEPHRRVAAAKLVIEPAPAASWEMAVLPGQDPSTLDGDHFFGYGVDAGTGAFIDASGGKALERLTDVDTEYDLDDALEDARKSDPPRMGVNLVDAETGINVVAFPSGWGDGVYPTWVGRDGDGQVVAVVTDFHVL